MFMKETFNTDWRTPEIRHVCIQLYKQMQIDVNPASADIVSMVQLNELLRDGWITTTTWQEKGAVFYTLQRVRKILPLEMCS